MKIFSSAILTLALIQSSNAFVLKGPSPVKTSGLVLGLADEFRSVPETSTASTANPSAPGMGNSPVLKNNGSPKSKQSDSVIVQGGSLRTWSFTSHMIDRVQVILTTEGRPLNADIDLWQGPDNTPQKMAVYIEDGALRPFNACLETPRAENTVAVRNTASMEYPLSAEVAAGSAGAGSAAEDLMATSASSAKIIQGGAIKTYSFGSPVGSVQILLRTDGRPLNARLELLQGPNNNKQVVDVYTEDGLERPFYVVIETPGSGNVVRIVNTATMEYPINCIVEPFSVEPGFDEASAQGGWDQTNDSSFFFLGQK